MALRQQGEILNERLTIRKKTHSSGSLIHKESVDSLTSSSSFCSSNCSSTSDDGNNSGCDYDEINDGYYLNEITYTNDKNGQEIGTSRECCHDRSGRRVETSEVARRKPKKTKKKSQQQRKRSSSTTTAATTETEEEAGIPMNLSAETTSAGLILATYIINNENDNNYHGNKRCHDFLCNNLHGATLPPKSSKRQSSSAQSHYSQPKLQLHSSDIQLACDQAERQQHHEQQQQELEGHEGQDQWTTVGDNKQRRQKRQQQEKDQLGDTNKYVTNDNSMDPFLIVLNEDGSDNAVITYGIVSLLDELLFHAKSSNCAATCTRSCSLHPQARTPMLAQTKKNNQSIKTVFQTLQHIQQNDKWSCGFRNLQMMLTAILPHLPNRHSYFHNTDTYMVKNQSNETVQSSLLTPTILSESLSSSPDVSTSSSSSKCSNSAAENTKIIIKIPSIKQLQQKLEDSWEAGYDPRGAKHYKYKVVGKPSKIGAVEVSSLMSYLGLDSTVVQFIRCSESRSLLPKFIWYYFHQKNYYRYHIDKLKNNNKVPHNGSSDNNNHTSQATTQTTATCYFCGGNVIANNKSNDNISTQKHSIGISSLSQAKYIMELVSSSSSASMPLTSSSPPCFPLSSCCECPLLPLYLQWEGHSVTVVGVEKITTNTIPASSSTTAINSSKNPDVENNQFTNNKAPSSVHNNHSDVHDNIDNVNLFILDPCRDGEKIRMNLSSNMLTNNNNNNINNPKGYNNNSNLSIMKINCNRKLKDKDCQLIMCSFKSLTNDEKVLRKKRINAVTAAQKAVLKAI